MHLFAANLQRKTSNLCNKQKCDQKFKSTQHRYHSTSPPLPLIHMLGDLSSPVKAPIRNNLSLWLQAEWWPNKNY